MLTFGLIFWILMLLWFLFGIWGVWQPQPNWWYGHAVFLFVLFFLLGWKVFGVPIHP
jgi:hypothetical protein